MQMPAYKSFSEFPETIKGYAAWVQQCKEWAEYRRWVANRRFHALPEDKGIPVPGTGVRRYRKSANGAGVSASSRVLSHYYADEGEKGRTVRKLVRSRERALWLSEWENERNEDAEYGYALDTYSAGDWFSDSLVWDEEDTVSAWDAYDDPGPYDVSDYVDFDPYDVEGYAEYCAYCGGECEL